MRRGFVILLISICGYFLIEPLKEVYSELDWFVFQLSRTAIIETLEDPVPIRGWNADGLKLEDGRTVKLPGFRSLPGNSTALTEVTKRGIEIDNNGRVWGLVRVWHTCGNDSVREEIARVDIAAMLLFLQVGEPVHTLPDHYLERPGGLLFEKGWYHLEYKRFRSWWNSYGNKASYTGFPYQKSE